MTQSTVSFSNQGQNRNILNDLTERYSVMNEVDLDRAKGFEALFEFAKQKNSTVTLTISDAEVLQRLLGQM